MVRFRALFAIGVLLMSVCADGQDNISMASLLKEMISYRKEALWPSPSYTMKQASSYDRRSVAVDKPGWFANMDFNQFIRTERNGGRTEYVMMDADGPGAVVRFWLTTQAKPGKLRLYFDNATEPTLEIPAYDLMRGGLGLGPALLNPHSSYEPGGKGGNTLYLPLPYQKHCKITFEFADSANLTVSHYYQINYRTYTAGTKVRTFGKADLKTYRGLIDSVEGMLWEPAVDRTAGGGKMVDKHMSVPAGGEMTLDLPDGPAAIRELMLNIAPSDMTDTAVVLRSVILRIDFDGHRTVWCPVGDFSGSGYGGMPVKSWYRDMSGRRRITSRWVMPYRKHARITILNNSPTTVDAAVSAVMDAWKWDNNSMYFHATYKYEGQIKDRKWDYDAGRVAASDTAAPIEWNFIRVNGRGIYLGNTLSVNNHMNSWYGEGDAKVWVDEDKFPSEFGTGLEDYYNTSWAPVVLYQTPFANAPRADNESSYGYNTFTRTRNLDGVPFRRSFRYDLEMLSWNGGTVDAAATVYWYGAEGAEEVSEAGAEQSEPYTRNLILLGECWGFLKYFHPAVRRGGYDWDSVLMVNLPLFNRPLTNAALNSLLSDWIDETDALAKKDGVALTEESQPGVNCPLLGAGELNDSVRARIRRVMAYHREMKNYYYDKKEEVGVGSFIHEKTYKDAADKLLPSAEYRLLTLFRIWNVFYYYAPYSQLTDRPWEEELGGYLPSFQAAKDTLTYHLLVREFVCKLNDGHAVVFSSPIYYGMGGGNVPPFIGMVYGEKLYVTRVINDSLCRLDGIKRGDVLLGVNGQTIAEKCAFLGRYIPWSSRLTLDAELGTDIFFSAKDSCIISRQTASGPVSSVLHLYAPAKLGNYPPPGVRKMFYDVNDSVTYINMEMLTAKGADSGIAALADKKVLIFDERGYPNNTWPAIMNHLLPGKLPFANIGYPSSAQPGKFEPVIKALCGPGEPNAHPFKGRVIILVDEGSQSHSEFTAMALQAFPGSYTIGRHTAGADGDRINLPLPGSMAARFSSLKIMYPDGRSAQRTGVRVDQVVRLTEEDLLSGRDAILEAGVARAVSP